MPNRYMLRLMVASIAGALTVAVPAQPPPTAFPPEIQPYVPRNVSPYFVVFLVAATPARAMTQELFIRHQAYMRRQFEAGVYRVGGPLTDGGRIRGMIVLSAPTREAALTIIAADPSVQEGVFTVELHSAIFPHLAALRIKYPSASH